MMTRRLTHAVVTVVAVVTVLLCLTLPATKASSQEAPKVLPNGSDHYGKSYGEWSARWWQWALTTPEDPVGDLTGEFAAAGQRGDVWFLAGVWGGLVDPEDLPVERTCTVPAGKALFFPLVNGLWITFPEDCPGEDPWKWFPENEWWIRDVNALSIDSAEGFSCIVDGEYSLAGPITGGFNIYRTFSSTFDVHFPEDGKCGPSVGDGYYIMLAPLSEGPHTIEFTAQMWWPWNGGHMTYQHVIYYLDVVRRPRRPWWWWHRDDDDGWCWDHDDDD